MKYKDFFQNKILPKLKKLLWFFLNPRLLLCVFIAWMITNGWSYVFTAVGAATGIHWMTAVGAAYMGFLWFPFTPEKLVTLIIAIFLMKLFFPKDEKTLGVLIEEYQKLKASVKSAAEKRKAKRAARREARRKAKDERAQKLLSSSLSEDSF